MAPGETIGHLEDLTVDVDSKNENAAKVQVFLRLGKVGNAHQPRRSGFCMGTTCTETSRTSRRKRLSTEPCKRRSQRDRAD